MSIRKKTWLTFLGIMVLTIFCGLVVWPRLPWPAFAWFSEKKVHLGLDLQGGTHLVYECDLSKIRPENYEEAVAGVRDVIERRVDALGVAEPVIQTTRSEGRWRLIIELAGIRDVEQAKAMIGETPSLDFRELIEIPLELPKEAPLPREEQKETESDSKKQNESKPSSKGLFVYQAWAQEKQEPSPADQPPTEQPPPDQPPTEPPELPQVQTTFVPTKLAGHHLKSAQLEFDPHTGRPQIGLEFDDEGTKLFAEITERNVGKPLAIFLDNHLISAPTVQEPIREGKAVITGDFTLKEAKDLAMRLNAGALPVPINLVSQQTVGATLGRLSVEKSFVAFIFGILCLILFMIFYYRGLGVVSVLALIVYGLIVLALYKLIPVTLTLSGIAGFIISFGMAVDANVLIFEGIKEGLRRQRPYVLAIEEGFKYAWGAIRDSNITTLITCAILAWFGTSLVKGFAITLGIGVLVSMFSAITVTRTFLRLFYKVPQKLDTSM